MRARYTDHVRGSVAGPIGALLAVMLVVVGAAQGLAAECGDTTRTWTEYSGNAHQVVRNTTAGKVFEVAILRNGVEKNRRIINESQPETSYLMKVGSPTEMAVTIEIQRRDNPGTEKVSCNYRISFSNEDGDPTKWLLPEGSEAACGDITQLCADCVLTCSKSYHSGKARWNTSFTISDPSS